MHSSASKPFVLREKSVSVLVRFLMLTLIFFSGLTTNGMAEGGYIGPFAQPLITVKQALSKEEPKEKNSWGITFVSIKGKITQISGNSFLSAGLYFYCTFSDSTGTINVSIPQSAFMGQLITENDTVEILGSLNIEKKKDADGTILPNSIGVFRVLKR